MEYKYKHSHTGRKLVLICLSLSLVFSGCKKFLDEVPTGTMTDQTEFTSAADGAALAVGPYRSLALWVATAADWGNYLPATLEYPTGGAFTSDTHVQFWKFQTNQVSGDLLDDFNNQWKNWYQGQRDCNFSISKLPGVTGMSESDRSKALGETRTLRAFYYFCLVRYFGDVVMDTAILKNVTEAEQPRVSLKKIYDEIIIPDLEFAVNQSALEDKKSADGRITKYVARAILADVYLTCAGYPYQEVATDPAKKWCVDGLWTQQGYPVNTPSAKTFLKKAQEQLNVLYGKYTLGTYDDLHDPAMNNKGEAVFQAQFKDGVTDNSVVATSLPGLSHVSMFGDEYGTFIPAMAYINSYDPSDKRIQDRQMFYYSDTKSTKYDPKEGAAEDFGRPYLYKYYDKVAIKSSGHSGLNWTFYRYADIELMLTEVNWALRQLGEGVSDNDLIKGINDVRARAELPAYRASEINALTIFGERACELVFENKMLWDQRRTRLCLVYGDGQFAGIRNFIGYRPSDFSFSFAAMNLLSPVAGREISTNAQCLQNAGYLPKQAGQ
ncbi:RagB/SusD family nutrient uptake outer membrane protein [Chitinophaga sp. MM2321]|uniref:RagB/SusD family nutrient uptake outer membrane protein n=1 Tax=Chitinophaga sp. MM2321 TaxID=3137178 RepID=UPI0032D5A2FA